MTRTASRTASTTRRWATSRRTRGAIGAAMLLATGMTLAGVSPSPVSAAVSGTLSGTVFRDFNANGTLDSAITATSATDVGVGGATVRAFDDTGAVVGTATSATDGTYSLPYSGAGTSPQVRVQLSMPAGYRTTAHGTAGTVQGGTTVQFKTNGDTANFGIARVGDYSQDSPDLVIPVHHGLVAGGATGPAALAPASSPTLLAVGYGTTGAAAIGTGAGNQRVQATLGQTGTVWGVAPYGTSHIFSGALFKRFTPVGPEGLGAVYLTAVNPVGAAASPNASLFVQIPDAGTNPRTGSAAATGDASLAGYDWFHDAAAFPEVHKIGLGDIDIAPDGRTLYAVNLNNRTLYAVPVNAPASPGAAPTAGTPSPIALPLALPQAVVGCAPASVRPFGIHVDDRGVWVALTCTGPADADARAYVYRYDPVASTFDGAPAFEASLTGARGSAYTGGTSPAAWHAWTDTFQNTFASNSNFQSWSQPVVSDLEFDSNGDLSLGIKDRNGDQNGEDAGDTNPASTKTYESFNAGDMLRACRNSDDTAFVLESAGACGSRTGHAASNNQGPGGGEFYEDEFGGSHQQTALGATEQVPGFAQIVSTNFDPLGNVRVGGFTKKNNADGSKANGTQLTGDARGTGGNTDPTRAGTFGKADGMGDIEALVAPAPIEIGNRVWNDTNPNGIQDAGETPVPGVTVHLYRGATLVATTTTDPNGDYYFGTADGVLPNTAYTIKLDKASDYASGGPLETKVLTQANAGVDDEVDSDGTVVGGFPQINHTTGDPGADDHTLDFGFVTPIDLTLSKTRVGTGPVFQGDTVTYSLVPHNNGPGDAMAGWSVTDVLPAGLTLAAVTGPAASYSCAGATCTATNGLASGANGPAITVTATVNAGFSGTAHNVAYIAPAPGDAVETNPLVIPGTGTDTGQTTTNNDAQADVSSQAPVSIGDYTFLDTNRNGIQDGGEPALPGVTVTLKDGGGTVVGTATTDGTGFYSFTGLRPDTDYTVTFTAPGYSFTTQTASGSTTGNDSNPGSDGVATVHTPATGANSATSPDDPTIDAGFVTIDLALAKSLTSTGVVVPGDTVTYSLVPHNNGPSDALGGWSVTEVVPAGLTLVTMSGPGYTCSGAVCTAAAGLANGADGPAITVTATVNAGFTGIAHNVAYVAPSPNDVPETNPLTVPTSSTDSQATPTNNDAQADLNSQGLVSIGDYTFIDVNRNGIQDAGEPALPGVTVTLKDAGGNVVGTTTTDDAGFYSFIDLRPDDAFTVTFATDGFVLTTQTASGSTNANDSNPDVATGIASVTAPSTGANSATTPDDPTIDAGFVTIDLAITKTLTSSGTIFRGDTVTFSLVPHNNGPADALPGWLVTEVVPAGLTLVSLAGSGYTCSGTVCTAAAGLASGANGPAITVTATVNAGFTGTAHNVAYIAPGPGEVPETNPLVVPDTSTDTQSTPTNNDDQADLVVSPPVSIGDYTFLDVNRNGIQDGGEPALPGVTVTLRDAGGNVVGIATTDDIGFYSFTDLRPDADYTVTFSAPGYFATTQTAPGSTAGNDSNPGSNGVATVHTPSTGANSASTPDDPTVDAGFVAIDLALAKSLTSTGVVVGGDTVTYSLVPHNNGPAGALAGWSVTEVVPAGLTLVSMTGPGYSCSGNVCTAAAGLVSGADGPVITVTATVNTGFTGTAHNVAFIAPSPNDGPETNPLVVPTTDTDTQATPTNNDAQADLSSRGLVSIGDFTFIDVNRNGIQDAGEPALSGVTVTLTDDGGATVGVATTDENGFYSFTGLRPEAAFTVTFARDGYVLTTQTAVGSTTANDSNPDVATGIASVTAPSTGANSATTPDDPTIDAGFVTIDLAITKTLTTSGLVFHGDTVTFSLVPHNNGPADALEGWSVTDVLPSGLTLVSLAGSGYTCSGNVCTAAAGLASGADGPAIIVTATVNAGFSGTAHNVAYVSPAPDEVAENNPLAIPSNETDTATTPTNNDDQADLVVSPPVSIGDYTFIDVNRNGIQDAAEPALPGVTVTLRDAGGNVVNTTTTDENGFYSFTGLRPDADYTVTFSRPGATLATPSADGSTPTNDSNPGLDGIATVHTPISGANSAVTPDDPTIDAGFVSIDLTITKKLVTTGVIRAGDTVTFSLVPHNNGPADALSGWSVTDLAPAGLTITSITGDPASYTCTETACTALVGLANDADGPAVTVTAKVETGFTGGRNVAYITPSPDEVVETNRLEVPSPGDDTTNTDTNNDSDAEIRVEPPVDTTTPQPTIPSNPNTPRSTPRASSPLARTGAEVGGLVALAITLLGLGFALVASRRRHTA